MKKNLKIDELFERGRQPEHQLQRIKSTSNSMMDVAIMNALKSRKRSVSAVAKYLKMPEQTILNNLNPKLFTTCDTGFGNMTIGFTPAALGL